MSAYTPDSLGAYLVEVGYIIAGLVIFWAISKFKHNRFKQKMTEALRPIFPDVKVNCIGSNNSPKIFR